MKPPRVSIATLMAAVMLIAIDCAALRLLRTDKSVVAVAFSGILPMASLLAGGLVLLVRGLWRQGECHPFLVGFEAFGVAALGLCFAWYALAFDSLVAYADAALTPLDAGMPEWQYTSALSVALTWPQLLVASAGGWLTCRIGIVLARRGGGLRPGESA
jgi:hypothetical protein